MRLKWIEDKNGSVSQFVTEVKRRMKGGSPVETPAAPSAQPDLAHQLCRLGELKSEGLLTEEEFQAQKQKLLG